MLPRSDEERNPGPTPVLDVQAERRVRLGRRVGRHTIGLQIAVVLASYIVRGVRLRDGAEEGDLRLLDRLRVASGRRLPGGCGRRLHRLVGDRGSCPTGRILEVATVLDPG